MELKPDIDINELTQSLQKKDDTLNIGGIIKYYREKLNLTQTLLSEEVSSYSYLSKVENNQLTPSASFIEGVSKKISVNLKSMMHVIHDEGTKKELIEAYYYKDINVFNKHLTSRESIPEDPVTSILKLGQALINKKLKQSRIYYRKLNRNQNTLGHLLDQLHLVMSTDYLLLEKQYSKALVMVKKNSHIAYNQFIEIILHQQAYTIKNALHMITNTENHFLKFIRLVQLKPSINRTLSMNATRILVQSKEEPYKSLDELKALYKTYRQYFEPNMAVYLFANINLKIGVENVNLWEKMTHEIKNEWYYKILGLLRKDDLSETQLIKLIQENELIEGPSSLDIAKLKVNTSPKKESSQYIKDLLLPLAIKYQNIDDLTYYKQELFDWLTNKKRYKEAFAIKDLTDKFFDSININRTIV